MAALLAALLCSLTTQSFAQSDAFVTAFTVDLEATTTGNTCNIYCDEQFSALKHLEVQVAGKGNFYLSYRDRVSCAFQFDIKIERIIALNSNGADPYFIWTLSCMFDDVITEMLRSNPFGWANQPTQPRCQVMVRVVKPSCWSRLNIGLAECPIAYEPCADNECCVDFYCVTFSAPSVVGDVIKGASSSEVCDENTAPLPPPNGQPCENVCEPCSLSQEL